MSPDGHTRNAGKLRLGAPPGNMAPILGNRAGAPLAVETVRLDGPKADATEAQS